MARSPRHLGVSHSCKLEIKKGSSAIIAALIGKSRKRPGKKRKQGNWIALLLTVLAYRILPHFSFLLFPLDEAPPAPPL
jgi:hypothetical protein